MTGRPARIDAVVAPYEPNFLFHVQSVVLCSGLDKRPIEEVSVVCDEHVRSHLQNVGKEAFDQSFLVRCIVNFKISFQVWTRGVLKILNISRHDFPVGDQVSLISKQYLLVIGE